MRAAILLLVALAVPALSQIKREQDPASAISGTAISPSTITITGTGYSIQATNGNVYAKYGVDAATGNFTGALRVVGELNGGAATTSGIFQLGAGPNGFDGARMNLCGSASATCGGTGAFQYFTKGNATADHIWYTDQGGGAAEQMRINGGTLKLMNATPTLQFDNATAGYITANGDLIINIDADINGSNTLRVRGNGGSVELVAVTETGATTLDVNGSAQFGSGATKSTFTATGFWEPISKTRAQIDLLVPTKVGQVIYASDTTLPGLCVSTGTAAAQWRKMESATLGCGTGN